MNQLAYNEQEREAELIAFRQQVHSLTAAAELLQGECLRRGDRVAEVESHLAGAFAELDALDERANELQRHGFDVEEENRQLSADLATAQATTATLKGDLDLPLIDLIRQLEHISSAPHRCDDESFSMAERMKCPGCIAAGAINEAGAALGEGLEGATALLLATGGGNDASVSSGRADGVKTVSPQGDGAETRLESATARQMLLETASGTLAGEKTTVALPEAGEGVQGQETR